MNTLSKILVVVFISISLQSISAYQDHINEVSTDGIVQVIDEGYAQGTGFFVSPHTLVTNFHIITDSIRKSQGSISKHLYIVHPVTGRWIPVHSIQAIGAGNDLAVLHIKDYESPVYYELFEESEETLSSFESYVFDRRESAFPILEGTLSSYYASQTIKPFLLPISLDVKGLSGSPVFSKEGKVIGVQVAAQKAQKTEVFLSRPKAVKELLLSSFFNCQEIQCVKEEMLLPESDRVVDELIEDSMAETIYLAEQGSMYDQYRLGLMYGNGKGVEPDYKEALKWYTLAAEQGHVYAQYNLGVIYDNGKKVEPDYEEAVKWYTLAAKQGFVEAQYNLGVMYGNGKGVEQDYEEAVKWYTLAAKQGLAYAQNNLGWMYSNGKGVKRDSKEAMKWYTLAAEQGHANAQYNLGVIYDNGK